MSNEFATKIFEENCLSKMKHFNLEQFKSSHPTLFKCILDSMDSYKKHEIIPVVEVNTFLKREKKAKQRAEEIASELPESIIGKEVLFIEPVSKLELKGIIHNYLANNEYSIIVYKTIIVKAYKHNLIFL